MTDNPVGEKVIPVPLDELAGVASPAEAPEPVADMETRVREFMREMGRKGGQKLKEQKLREDPNYYEHLSARGVAARREKALIKRLAKQAARKEML